MTDSKVKDVCSICDNWEYGDYCNEWDYDTGYKMIFVCEKCDEKGE